MGLGRYFDLIAIAGDRGGEIDASERQLCGVRRGLWRISVWDHMLIPVGYRFPGDIIIGLERDGMVRHW